MSSAGQKPAGQSLTHASSFPPTLSAEQVAHARTLKGRRERTEWLTDLVSHAVYVHRRTDAELAAIWGVTRDYVGVMVGEANRAMAMQWAPERSEEIRAALLARIGSIGMAAMERRREVVDRFGNVHSVSDPDMRTALQAVVETSVLLSIRQERHHHEHDLSSWSEEQLIEGLKASGYDVSKKTTVETTGEPVAASLDHSTGKETTEP